MVNSVFLMGRLTREPEVRNIGEGKNVANYSLAVPSYDGQNTTFIDCVSFGKTAEFVEKYFHKGQKVVVQGRLDVGSYEHVDDHGEKTRRFYARVVVNAVDFAEARTNVTQEQKTTDGLMDIPEDAELPFK